LIIAAIAGSPGYYAVSAISGIQVLFFLGQERSLSAFPTQIRVAYFAFTLFGFWPELRLFIYVKLLTGTIMVTFFSRCAIALVLKQMPWNQGREDMVNQSVTISSSSPRHPETLISSLTPFTPRHRE
jgi:hypothetical protein